VKTSFILKDLKMDTKIDTEEAFEALIILVLMVIVFFAGSCCMFGLFALYLKRHSLPIFQSKYPLK
jgi:thiol:disulfide interchange protein